VVGRNQGRFFLITISEERARGNFSKPRLERVVVGGSEDVRTNPRRAAGLAGNSLSGGRREWQGSGGIASRRPDTSDGNEHATGRNRSASSPS
jgi:hypothetical protein